MIQKVKGTQDILPEESRIWTYIENIIRNTCKNYGFKEVRIPIIEHTEVFTKSIGLETDIVTKEMYTFQTKGDKSITLRPEGTAGTVRCYSENKIYGRENITRWFYFGPMFRAERPQKGRQRQFHQFGIEYIGVENPIADAEVILLNLDILKKLGLKNITLKINSVGDENSRPAYINALKIFFNDKIENLCEQCRIRYEKNVLRMLDCKVDSCQPILNSSPSITDYLDDESKKHFDSVLTLLKDVNYVIDKRLVRGLDYYTRTAFEITSSDLGGQDALAGGGRYDNLIEIFSDKKTPAVGSAIGLERLIIALTASGAVITDDKGIDIYVCYFSDEHLKTSFEILNKLRNSDINAVISDKAKKIGLQLKDADKLNSKYALIIGDDEIKTQRYTLKNLLNGTQETGLEIADIILKVKHPVVN